MPVWSCLATPAARNAVTTAAVAGAGRTGARSASARAAVSNSTPSTEAKLCRARRSLRAAAHPMDAWSSCIAEVGMESTEAGTANRLSSATSAACV